MRSEANDSSTMRRLTIAIVCLALLAARGEELDVPFHRQNTLVWCWAAAVAMVGQYRTGQTAEDCEVLSAYDRMFGGPGMCCQFPQRCMRTGAPQEMKIILSNVFGLSGYHHGRPLSYRELQREIDADRPFIAALRSGFGGHVVVVTGYEAPDNVILLDPMSGRRQLPYQVLVRNFGGGAWVETFTVGSGGRRTDAAPPARAPVPYCCDAFGRKRCIIQISPGPAGSVCGCVGQGYGATCY